MLNPELYKRLESLYGRVRVHSEDDPAEALQFITGSVLSREGKKRKPFFKPKGGEQYGIKCPFCGKDDKLYINHMYGTKAKPPGGGPLVSCSKRVFHCYYCQFNKKDENKFKKFIKSLDTGALGDIVIDPEIIQRAEAAMRARRPEDNFPVCVPITAPEAAGARAYLESRNFDISDLENNWRVLYSRDARYFPHPYIIFPIFDKGKLVSWQGRYVGDDNELKGAPKYYFDPSFKKSHVVYNMDRARHNSLGVLVEGIPSVIRIGAEHGVTAFGKFPSARQLKILRGMYSQGTLVVIFDNDAKEETREQIDEWQAKRFFRRLINIEMPDDRDPADYTTEAIWNIINKKLKETI